MKWVSKLSVIIYLIIFQLVWLILATYGTKSDFISLIISLLFCGFYHRSKILTNIILAFIFAFADTLLISVFGCKYVGVTNLPPSWIVGMWMIFLSFYRDSKLPQLNFFFTLTLFGLGGYLAGSSLYKLGSLDCNKNYILGLIWAVYGVTLKKLYLLYDKRILPFR